jgi:hypothetical protein
MWKRSSHDHAPSGERTPLRGLVAVPIVAVLLMALMPAGIALAAPSSDPPPDPCAAAAQRGSPGDCPDPSTPTPSGSNNSNNNSSNNNGGKNNGGKKNDGKKNDPPFFCIHSNSENSDSNGGCNGEGHPSKEGSNKKSESKRHPPHPEGEISKGVKSFEALFIAQCSPSSKHFEECQEARQVVLDRVHETIGFGLACLPTELFGPVVVVVCESAAAAHAMHGATDSAFKNFDKLRRE